MLLTIEGVGHVELDLTAFLRLRVSPHSVGDGVSEWCVSWSFDRDAFFNHPHVQALMTQSRASGSWSEDALSSALHAASNELECLAARLSAAEEE